MFASLCRCGPEFNNVVWFEHFSTVRTVVEKPLSTFSASDESVAAARPIRGCGQDTPEFHRFNSFDNFVCHVGIADKTKKPPKNGLVCPLSDGLVFRWFRRSEPCLRVLEVVGEETLNLSKRSENRQEAPAG
jgi:hypothetical protein